MNEIERRTLNIEMRLKDAESRTVSGYAVVFNQLSEPIWWFREKISPKAFDEADMSETVAVLNHNLDIVFARAPKTLKLIIDEYGLLYEFEAPKTTAGNDLIELLSRGDIYQSSFSFTVAKENWEKYRDDQFPDVTEIRTIEKIEKLYDVSAVTFPAYKQTTVNVERMRAEYEQRMKQIEINEFQDFEETEKLKRLRLLDYQQKLLNFYKSLKL